MGMLIWPFHTFAKSGKQHIFLKHIGNYDSGMYVESAADIVAYDPATKRLIVSNADQNTIDILDSPSGKPLLAVSYEVSGSIEVFLKSW